MSWPMYHAEKREKKIRSDPSNRLNGAVLDHPYPLTGLGFRIGVPPQSSTYARNASGRSRSV